MKIIQIAMISLFILVSSTGCHEEEERPADTTAVTALIDITSGEVALPTQENLEKIFDLKRITSKGGIFKISPISDVTYNPAKRFEIVPKLTLFSNPTERRKDIEAFYSDISMALASYKAQGEGKPKSKVWAPIARSLNELSSLDASTKIALIFSDLGENDLFSIYRKEDFERLVRNPESVQAEFDSQVKLKDMTSVTVYLIYSAPNSEESDHFTGMANLIKKAVEAKGGKVIIEGSFIN
jgi:hypothetical protein